MLQVYAERRGNVWEFFNTDTHERISVQAPLRDAAEIVRDLWGYCRISPFANAPACYAEVM